MHVSESSTAAPAEPDVSEPHARRRPKVLAAALVVLLLAAFSVWWFVTTPKLVGGGLAHVSSPDHEVVMATGLREVVYVVPADGSGSSTLAFGIHNDGPLPVEIVDVWPSTDDPLCFWRPRERWFQDDPRHMGVLDKRARPAVGATLAPSTSATIWITGAHPDPTGCEHAAINLHDDVEVVTRAGGRTSTTRVALGYTFGYSDDPESLRSSFDYRVLPPTTVSPGG